MSLIKHSAKDCYMVIRETTHIVLTRLQQAVQLDVSVSLCVCVSVSVSVCLCNYHLTNCIITCFGVCHCLCNYLCH